MIKLCLLLNYVCQKCIERTHDCLDNLLFDRLMPSPLPNQPGIVRSVSAENKPLVALTSMLVSVESTTTVEKVEANSDASSVKFSTELLELKDFGVKHMLLLDKNPIAAETEDSDIVGQMLEWLFSVC